MHIIYVHIYVLGMHRISGRPDIIRLSGHLCAPDIRAWIFNYPSFHYPARIIRYHPVSGPDYPVSGPNYPVFILPDIRSGIRSTNNIRYIPSTYIMYKYMNMTYSMYQSINQYIYIYIYIIYTYMYLFSANNLLN